MNKINVDNFNLFNDSMFKNFVKSIEARNMVSSFLSSVTGIRKEVLQKAKYISEELDLDKYNEKKKTSDVIVKIDNHNRIILEMNQSYSKNIFYKNTQYAWNISNYLTKTGQYEIYTSVILINIDNFNHYNTDKPILHFKLRDQYGNVEHDMYNFIHLIVDNILKEEYNIDKEIKKFIRFISKTNIKDINEEFKKDDDYMAGRVRVEDMLQDIDKHGLLYDYDEEMQDRIKGSYEYGVEQGAEQKTKESAINFYKNGISKELIIKSLNITEEQLEDYLK